jgi:hypothetical protein
VKIRITNALAFVGEIIDRPQPTPQDRNAVVPVYVERVAHHGAVLDVEDDEGKRLVDSGQAEEVDADTAVTDLTGAAPVPETTPVDPFADPSAGDPDETLEESISGGGGVDLDDEPDDVVPAKPRVTGRK